MKRTIYIPYYNFPDKVHDPESALNQTCLVVYDKKLNVPYIEVEMKVIYNEPNFLHKRTPFAEKLGASIIIPGKFTGDKK